VRRKGGLWKINKEMDRRIITIQKIQFALAFVVARVKISNSLNLTDISIIAEDFFKTLFNLLYDYDLKNANSFKQNESAIDLFFNTDKIAYQITSQNKATKISETVTRFIKTEKYLSYSTIIIFSITAENKCSSNALQKLEEYNVNGKYINVSDLEREIITNLETEKLELIAQFLEYETNPYRKNKPKSKIAIDKKLKSLHIIDQIDTVLRYFDGFSLIHPRTLSKLYPFNTDKRTYDTYSNYCLKTNLYKVKLFIDSLHLLQRKIYRKRTSQDRCYQIRFRLLL
jgi:hypothetical protein